ncbi:MAG TPA: mechanosensitive ion channel family protein [Gemmataceae bacterium]|nr:mechanosensitive ion channel family protein [Gemmataceae bacterium]
MLYPFAQIAADGRLLANLIAVHLLVLLALGLSVGLRWLVTHSSNRLARWAGTDKLKEFSAEATRHGHTMLFWLTVTVMALTAVGGVVYQFAGRDVRADLGNWYSLLTPEDIVRLGVAVGGVVVLAVLTSTLVRVLRRVLPLLETYALTKLGHPKNEATLRHWFHLVDVFIILSVRLTALGAACMLLGLGTWAVSAIAFVLYVVAIVALARLLTLACRASTHLVADYGTKHLGQKPLYNYWDRVTRLFPFGERCFEVAVYVMAGWLIVGAFHLIAIDAEHFGPRIVACIGIFFGTRVVIELLQVLLNDAFGLYKNEGEVDQKARTLVPLLHSMCQYVLYFGSCLLMLGVLGINTTPFLAAASILGLAVGLGAQSLVTDVVSGFFILFENQFLVGDYVKIGDAAGVVEEVGMRVTKIRDEQGKQHIIPNGQIKGVVSYSKGYVNAVVDVKMPSGSDLETQFKAMKEAGRRLRKEHRQVLADTEIHGLIEWNNSDMTIRAVTKVQPGAHAAMQSEYRRLLKQVFDEKQTPMRAAA